MPVTGLVAAIIVLGTLAGGVSMAGTQRPRSEDGVVHQVRLEGDISPFDVVDDDSIAPLRVGAQGPPVRFELPVEVAELIVPGQVTVPPMVRFGDPNLRAVKVTDMIYAGRVSGSSLEATVFSFGTEDGPQVGIYFFDGDLIISVASTPPDLAPGASRTRVNPPEGHVDLTVFGPLAPAVAVVVLQAERRPVAAVRPRARFALFDTLNLGVPRNAELRLLGYGSTGNLISEATVPPLRREDEV
jgi:hypothetical protein